jgi:hypothetical protein
MGLERLKEFEEAPTEVQDAFWKQLGREVGRRNEVEVPVQEAYGISAGPWLGPFTRWDGSWQSRANRRKATPLQPTFQTQKERLLEVPAREYVELLLACDVGRSGKICCPLHEERTPSFAVRGLRWRCFGCGRNGDIYYLAGQLWGFSNQGADFRRLHDRLMDLFP